MTPRRYQITHRTTYRYHGGAVSSSLGTCHLRPRDLPWQRVYQHEVEINPAAAVRAERLDLYGNHQTHFHVTAPHTELVITARTDCAVSDTRPDGALLSTPWEQARPCPDPAHGRPAEADQPWDFLLASPRVALPAEATAYAAASFRPGRPVGEAVLDLVHRIHGDFAYQAGTTTVTTSVAEVLASRRGVCQDFAQVMISCLRSMGLAARYVSGYLATVPPPGRERLIGADASHAWVSVWLPGTQHVPGSWWALDPTNDRPCDQSHATVAWGRDYADVAPVRGIVWSTSATSAMEVSVDMAPHPDQ